MLGSGLPHADRHPDPGELVPSGQAAAAAGRHAASRRWALLVLAGRRRWLIRRAGGTTARLHVQPGVLLLAGGGDPDAAGGGLRQLPVPVRACSSGSPTTRRGILENANELAQATTTRTSASTGAGDQPPMAGDVRYLLQEWPMTEPAVPGAVRRCSLHCAELSQSAILQQAARRQLQASPRSSIRTRTTTRRPDHRLKRCAGCSGGEDVVVVDPSPDPDRGRNPDRPPVGHIPLHRAQRRPRSR